MKKPWKTRKGFYISRFAFIGYYSSYYDVSGANQISISSQLYYTFGNRKFYSHLNIKRDLVNEWKSLNCWGCDE